VVVNHTDAAARSAAVRAALQTAAAELKLEKVPGLTGYKPSAPKISGETRPVGPTVPLS